MIRIVNLLRFERMEKHIVLYKREYLKIHGIKETNKTIFLKLTTGTLGYDLQEQKPLVIKYFLILFVWNIHITKTSPSSLIMIGLVFLLLHIYASRPQLTFF